MSDSTDDDAPAGAPDSSGSGPRAGAKDRERRRAARLRAMGGVLRDVAGDEAPGGWGEPAPTAEDRGRDADLRREVPPHHGG